MAKLAVQLDTVEHSGSQNAPHSCDLPPEMHVDSALLLGEGDLTGLTFGPMRLPSTPYEVRATVKRAHVRLEPAGLIRGLVDLREGVLSDVDLQSPEA